MGPQDGQDKRVGDASGEGKIWSLTGVLLAAGRYRLFKDGSGWFACDPCNLVLGQTVELETIDGQRLRVQISRIAERNCLFRPAPAGSPAATS